MEYMEDKEWLKELKVGDKVIIVDTEFSQVLSKVETVKRITSTGLIITDSMSFLNGDTFSSGKHGIHYSYLKEYSEEEYTALTQKHYAINIHKRLKNIFGLTFEQAKAIADIMKW